MGLKIICPWCRFRTVFEASYAGKKAKCPRCAKAILIPVPVAEVAPEPVLEKVPEEPVVEEVLEEIREEEVFEEPVLEEVPEEVVVEKVIPQEEAPEEKPRAAKKKGGKAKRRARRKTSYSEEAGLAARLGNGFALLGCTWRVLASDFRLLLFPLLSLILLLLVLGGFLLALDQAGQLLVVFAVAGVRPAWVYLVLFGLYLSLNLVTVFGKVALVKCATLRFTGKAAGLDDGFMGAVARLPQIFAWSVVSATFGLLLTIIEHIHKKIGEFVAKVLGVAWGLMTYFVIPALAAKGRGPFQAIGRSVKLLRETWGEARSSNLGLRLVLNILLVPSVVLLIVGFILGSWIMLLGAAAAYLAYLTVGQALDVILCAALYQYAVDGKVPEPFDPDLMAVAFALKPGEEYRRGDLAMEVARWRNR
jgi:hypothetical protein